MYKYISSMCSSCPGCALTNPTRGKSRELIYNFPIEAPFMVLHIDVYQAGAESGFKGSSHYLIAACGMCTFAVMEPIHNANATTYASAIMKIILRYVFCHTVVLNKDCKFFGMCREALDLLQINCHVLSGANHNPMIVECLNRYLNQGLRIMRNECDMNRIALEGILLLIYAWNLFPVPGTNISRSMVTVGCEFAFPINFSVSKHVEVFSAPGTVTSYSKELATRLESCRKIAMLLVKEQHTWHRELINSRRRGPPIYNKGDIVFARRATQLDAKRSRVEKLMHPFTGPWRIVKSLDGASYELEFVGNPSRREKKHSRTYPLTRPNSSLFDRSTPPTAGTASSITPLAKAHTRKPASTVSLHRNHSALRVTSSRKVTSAIFIFPPLPSSTMNSGPFPGLTTTSDFAYSPTTTLSKCKIFIRARHHLWPSQVLHPLPP